MESADRIDGAVVEGRSRTLAVRGQIFVDGSGDGDPPRGRACRTRSATA